MMDDELDGLEAMCIGVDLSAIEWVRILLRYKTVERLKIAMPLLRERNPGRKFTHADLARIVGASREKVTRALGQLTRNGEYHGEMTGRRHRGPKPKKKQANA
jgi:hypothetical protein